MAKSKDAITLARDFFDEFLTKADPDYVVAGSTLERNAQAKAAGRLGGLKGGKVRTLRLSAKKRKKIAKKAAKSLWSKERLDS